MEGNACLPCPVLENGKADEQGQGMGRVSRRCKRRKRATPWSRASLAWHQMWGGGT